MLEETDERGWPLVHTATGDLAPLKGALSQTRRLLSWADNRGQSPVHVALRHGHADQLEGLPLGHLCMHDHLGQTPIHIAVQHRHLDQIVSLLSPAALAMRTALNATALDLAKESGHLGQLPEKFIKETEAYLAAEEKRAGETLSGPGPSHGKQPWADGREGQLGPEGLKG